MFIKNIPAVCADELAALEFLESPALGDAPACVHCGSVQVYKMLNSKKEHRHKRFLWRCWTATSSTPFVLRLFAKNHALPFVTGAMLSWRASTPKIGVSALEIKMGLPDQLQVSDSIWYGPREQRTKTEGIRREEISISIRSVQL